MKLSLLFSLLFIPFALFLLALKNKRQLKKLKFSGKVPAIHAAARNYDLFSWMSLLSLVITIIYYLNSTGEL